jgi:hypothetical protein
LAKIAWTWSLQLVRRLTSLTRYAEDRIMPMLGRLAWGLAVAVVKASA